MGLQQTVDKWTAQSKALAGVGGSGGRVKGGYGPELPRLYFEMSFVANEYYIGADPVALTDIFPGNTDYGDFTPVLDENGLLIDSLTPQYPGFDPAIVTRLESLPAYTLIVAFELTGNSFVFERYPTAFALDTYWGVVLAGDESHIDTWNSTAAADPVPDITTGTHYAAIRVEGPYIMSFAVDGGNLVRIKDRTQGLGAINTVGFNGDFIFSYMVAYEGALSDEAMLFYTTPSNF